MVAPSFQKMEIMGEPFVVSGRSYVRIKNPKTGNIRQVRWYNEAEYAKLYPDTAVAPVADLYTKPQKEVLGFTKGYITIFKGDVETNNDWFRLSPARYTRWWGWYFISTIEIPSDLPSGVIPVQLPWEVVGQDNGRLKNENEVYSAVNDFLYENHGEFVGSVGDRLELDVVVKSAFETQTQYGKTTIHTFEDADGHIYIWATASKSWTPGSKKRIRGTVKEHRTFKGMKETVLTRCAERT